MYCVSRMTEFWGSYGESGGSYIREAKGGSFTGLLPYRIALIELDTERGTYIVTGRDGGIIAMSTIKRNEKPVTPTSDVYSSKPPTRQYTSAPRMRLCYADRKECR